MNKKILTIVLLMFSVNTFSSQLELLEKGQEGFVDSFNQTVKKYCEVIYKVKDFKERSFTDCYLQMKFDCKHSESRKIKQGACVSLEDLKKLEDFFAVTEKSLLSLEENRRTISSEGESEETKPLFVDVPKLAYGVPNFLCQADESLEESGNTSVTIESVRAGNERLDAIQADFSSLKKIRVDCSEDSDCEAIGFGERLCGGNIGSFVISKKDPNFSSAKKMVNEFNQLDDKLQQNIKGFASTCSVHVVKKPTCKQNRCR